MMSKVFVTQYSPHLRFAEASEYGEVVFLTDKEFRPEPSPPGANDVIIVEIVRNLQEYIPGEDYIALTGSAIPNLVVGGVVKGLRGPHKVLKWSNRSKNYELFLV
jgi:hypothetical protein